MSLIDMNGAVSEKDTSIITLNSYQLGVLYDALLSYSELPLTRSQKFAVGIMIDSLRAVFSK